MSSICNGIKQRSNIPLVLLFQLKLFFETRLINVRLLRYSRILEIYSLQFLRASDKFTRLLTLDATPINNFNWA